MLYSTSSFLDPNLSPLSRVYRIWFVAFSLRCWRSWIIAHPSYTLEHNFVSSNVYLCVEINAHSLVMILIRLKRENKAHLLLPWLFGSQPAEIYFRLLRSLSPMENTQVNFTSIECNEWRCQKADAALLLSSRGKELGLSFPEGRRLWTSDAKESSSLKISSLDEILNEILKAKSDVHSAFLAFGKTKLIFF